MPVRDLEVEIMKGRRRFDGPFDLHEDPDNTPALRQYLVDWLAAEKWAPGHWGKFSMDVRIGGQMRPIRRVRV